MLLRVAIIDERETYRDTLVNALSTDYADKLELSSFSSIESFDDFLTGASVDVMLVSSTFGDETLEGRQGATLAYLVDDKAVERMYGRVAICRFQKVDLIYKDILAACMDRFDSATFRHESIEGTTVLSFFPASGGAGASSMAAACALGAAKRGLRTFYLNLELYGHSNMYFSAEGTGNMGDILFAIEAKKKNVATRIQSLTRRSRQGVCFLDPCDTPVDLIELPASHVEELIRSVAASDTYDVIVLDLDYSNSPFAPVAMEFSDNSVFVSNGSFVSNDKFERIYAVLSATNATGTVASGAEGILLAYNNFDERTGRYLTGDLVTVVGALPHVESDSPRDLIDKLSNSAFFDHLLSFDERQE